MTDSNLIYLLIGITAVNIVMILWMDWKLARVSTDLHAARQAIIILAKGLGEVRETIKSAGRSTPPVHNTPAHTDEPNS